MRIEILNTGTELLTGQVLNTHQQWLGERLARTGHPPARLTVVDDTPEAIGEAVATALDRSDLVLITGGLGPTADDRTREVVARLLDLPLEEDEALLEAVRERFVGRRMPDRVRLQALVPRGAHVLPNRHGTAPGLALRHRRKGRERTLLMLPGPPRELRPMFLEEALPWLRAGGLLPAGGPVVRILRTAGMGESLVEERLEPLRSSGLEIGYCARPGCVDIRLVSRDRCLVDRAAVRVREILGDPVYGEGDQTLESVTVGELARSNLTLATVESCTGGLIAQVLTDVPGASRVLDSGWITYSNASKIRLPRVSSGSLADHGAVSEPVAREMAEGVRREAGTDLGLSITGIAGPSGGTPRKPTGTVFLACAAEGATTVRREHFPLERTAFKRRVLVEALRLLRRVVRST